MENLEPEVQCIDLMFQGKKGAIASYLLETTRGGILVESGPGSTIPALISGLDALGLDIKDISDVLLTHIHLDHAGAAGWLSRQGINIHVHPNGAQHLLDPSKLLNSAERIYGDSMSTLWGEFLPVIPKRLIVHQDGDLIEIDNLRLLALDTPGHAKHHFVYITDHLCFSGDIGGIRLSGSNHVFLPTPPPEFNLEIWKASIEKISRHKIARIAPTHFGIFDQATQHLLAVELYLDDLNLWLEKVMRMHGSVDLLSDYKDWLRSRYTSEKMRPQLPADYELVNPVSMSLAGLQRYWNKYRLEEPS
jgi:glyoxylase-like metal-dependent hydrolase (beta-lactamase superfamily II)